MAHAHEQAYGRLLEALGDPWLTPFVGAGLSAAATDNDKCATWRGLLQAGVEICARETDQADDWVKEQHDRLKRDDKFALMAVAGEVAGRLRSLREQREFKSWITNSVGSLRPTASGRRIIKSVCSLGDRVISTNYDDLIEQTMKWKSYSWDDGSDFATAHARSQVVLHLHGVASRPESVILDNADYQRLRNSLLNERLSAALFVQRAFIFIGCGDGMSDPHIAPLLEEMIELIPDDGPEHFILCTTDERSQFKDISKRISPVVYGETYDELPQFLHQLVAARGANGGPGPPQTAVPAAEPAAWLMQAEQAQASLDAALHEFETAEDALNHVRRRSVLPRRIEEMDFAYQRAKHEESAAALMEPARALDDSLTRIHSALTSVAEQVWRLALPSSAVRPARLAPVTELMSELVSVIDGLMNELAPNLHAVRNRTAESASYEAPSAALAHAQEAAERTRAMAIALRDGLTRQQQSGGSDQRQVRPSFTPVDDPVPSPARPQPAPRPRYANHTPEETAATDSEVRRIRVLGEAAAGAGVSIGQDSGETLPVPARFVGRKDAFAVRVRGDSMEGDGVLDGDYAVVVHEPEPRDGQMVVLITEGPGGVEDWQGRVKRLRRDGETGFSLVSSPPVGDPEPVPRDDLREIHRVVGILRGEIPLKSGH